MLPMSSMLVFLPALFGCGAQAIKILGVLGMCSMLATAYTLVFIPRSKQVAHTRGQIEIPQSARTPFQRLLPIVNGLLCLYIGWSGLSWRDYRGGAHYGFWLLCWTPAGNEPSLPLKTSLLTLSSRTDHDHDRAEVPRCHRLFRGGRGQIWPQRSLTVDVA